MKNLIIVAIFTFLASAADAQGLMADSEGSLVNWITLTEALEKTKTAPRPIVLDFYTDWCGWCKRMMKTTYADPGLAQYINTNFYPVKFNAESRDTVEYLGIKYGPSASAPKAAHALAIKLLQGKLVYPTTLFLNNYDKVKNEFGFSMLAQGYLDVQKIEPILVFLLENVFRNSGYEDFAAQYKLAFYDSAASEKFKALKWLKPSEFFSRGDSSNKKSLVLVHTEWCNACRVMKRASFIDPSLEKLLNDKFDLVDFNAEIPDQITFKGQVFGNLRSPQAPFHQLATALCRNNIVLPTLVVLDEKMTVLDAVPFFLNPKMLKDISTYFGDNIYKNKSWNDYMNPLLKQ